MGVPYEAVYKRFIFDYNLKLTVNLVQNFLLWYFPLNVSVYCLKITNSTELDVDKWTKSNNTDKVSDEYVRIRSFIVK